MLAVGIRKRIQGIFTRHNTSKKWEGWKQEEPSMVPRNGSFQEQAASRLGRESGQSDDTEAKSSFLVTPSGGRLKTNIHFRKRLRGM